MSDDLFKGYKGRAKKVLQDNKVKVWSDVILKTKDGEHEGIILPRAETADDIGQNNDTFSGNTGNLRRANVLADSVEPAAENAQI